MPAQPSVTPVRFGEVEFLAFSTALRVFTPYGPDGMMPLMGQTQTAIEVFVDMHDNENLSFDKASYLFTHSHTLTSDKVQDCKLTFWTDDRRQDALSTFAFRGWIAHFGVLSGGGSNHLLMLRFQPLPDSKQFVNILHGN